MKRKHLALLPLVIGTLFGAAAQAENITFQGTVFKNTCIPDVEGSGVDGVVTLNPITSNLLTNTGNTAGEKKFTISLTQCDTTIPHTIKAYFWQTGAVNGRLIRNSGNGSGWEYQLLDSASNPLPVGTTSTVNEALNANDPGAAIDASGSGTLNYSVRYYRATGVLNVGNLNAIATYVLYAN